MRSSGRFAFLPQPFVWPGALGAEGRRLSKDVPHRKGLVSREAASCVPGRVTEAGPQASAGLGASTASRVGSLGPRVAARALSPPGVFAFGGRSAKIPGNLPSRFARCPCLTRSLFSGAAGRSSGDSPRGWAGAIDHLAWSDPKPASSSKGTRGVQGGTGLGGNLALGFHAPEVTGDSGFAN